MCLYNMQMLRCYYHYNLYINQFMFNIQWNHDNMSSTFVIISFYTQYFIRDFWLPYII